MNRYPWWKYLIIAVALLIGLIYGCGLRCMEVRNIKLHTQNAAQ